MKQHTGMEAHDGFAPHSHEVRADHLGVQQWCDYCDTYHHQPPESCVQSSLTRDRNGIEIPDGWAVYFDGELVFSVDEDKWREIGPGIEKIMEG